MEVIMEREKSSWQYDAFREKEKELERISNRIRYGDPKFLVWSDELNSWIDKDTLEKYPEGENDGNLDLSDYSGA
jgi:hypothetical protein